MAQYIDANSTVAHATLARLRLHINLTRLLDRLRPKRAAYRAVFSTLHGRAILRDLAPFCCASAPATTERDMGRRDVWLRIQHFVRMDDEELTVLYAALTPEQRHQIYRPGLTFVEDE